MRKSFAARSLIARGVGGNLRDRHFFPLTWDRERDDIFSFLPFCARQMVELFFIDSIEVEGEVDLV